MLRSQLVPVFHGLPQSHFHILSRPLLTTLTPGLTIVANRSSRNPNHWLSVAQSFSTRTTGSGSGPSSKKQDYKQKSRGESLHPHHLEAFKEMSHRESKGNKVQPLSSDGKMDVVQSTVDAEKPRKSAPHETGRRRERVQMDIEPKYTEFWSQEDIDRGVKEGRVVLGAFHLMGSRKNIGFVRLNNGQRDVYVEGLEARNRAMDGDYVAVELGPEIEQDESKSHAASGARKLVLQTPDLVAEANDPLWAPTEYTNSLPSADSTIKPLEEVPKNQRSGRVVAVLAANTGVTNSADREFASTIIGKLQAACSEKLLQKGNHLPSTETFAYFVPSDNKIPKIRILRGELPYEFTQDPLDHSTRFLYSGKITSWPSSAKEPTGVLLGRIGQAGEIGTETQALLMAHGVDHGEFPQAALDCLNKFLPPRDTKFEKPGEAWWTIPSEELARRKDLRSTLIFTIDPYTAKDIDDALHCIPLGNGEYEMGVHIADVSYFVERGSALDEEAQRRSTSVYLVQKVIPMLPALLSEELCSLNPNVDRLAFSCIWRMNAKGELVPNHPPWFGRTIIRSACKLHYGLAQKIIDEGPSVAEWTEQGRTPEAGKWTKEQVCGALRDLHLIGMARRKLRFDPERGGALEMTTSKMSFALDPETGNPTGVTRYPMHDTNRLVEEFMLLANFLVAQRLIQSDRGNAFLRHHPPPDANEMSKMVEILQRSCGVSLFENNKISPSAIHEALMMLRNQRQQSSASTAADPAKQEEKDLSEVARNNNKKAMDEEAQSTTLHIVASEMLKKPMKNALYFIASDLEDFMWRHWALNIKYYTHFTSPIRRYADVCVHRQLTRALDASLQSQPVSPDETKFLRYSADRCNEKKEASRQAQESSDDLYLNLLLRSMYEKKTPFSTEAVVIDLGPKSFTVLLPELGITKRVHVNDDFRWAVLSVEMLESNKQTGQADGKEGPKKKGGGGGGIGGKKGDDVEHADEGHSSSKPNKGGKGRENEGTVISIKARDPKSNLIIEIKVLTQFRVSLIPKSARENMNKAMDFKLIPENNAPLPGIPDAAQARPHKPRQSTHREREHLPQHSAQGSKHVHLPKERSLQKASVGSIAVSTGEIEGGIGAAQKRQSTTAKSSGLHRQTRDGSLAKDAKPKAFRGALVAQPNSRGAPGGRRALHQRSQKDEAEISISAMLLDHRNHHQKELTSDQSRYRRPAEEGEASQHPVNEHRKPRKPFSGTQKPSKPGGKGDQGGSEE